MINMTVEVKTSKAIAIQILRHWSIKPQEFSQRYAEVTEIEPIVLRKSGSTDRQSSTDVFDPMIRNPWHTGLYPASETVKQLTEYSQFVYKELLQEGVAKECARMILPMATSTTMYLNGSVRSWIHYMEQRCDKHAQAEHQEVANLLRQIFIENFPNIAKALNL